MKILWLGPFHSDVALKEKLSPNQAASRWSRGLLRGLESAGCEIRVIDHCSEQRWPNGRVFWQDNNPRWFLDWYPCVRIPYCNAWGVKEYWLSWAYARAIRKVIKMWRPDIVLCYNSLHKHNVSAIREATRFGIKGVPIILDGADPRRDNWKKLLYDNRFGSGVVFLSWWMYQNYPDDTIPRFHMDGGADGFKGEEPKYGNKPYTLVHTGALDYWRGLDFMKGVVKCCKRLDVRFVFCGKCDRAKMWSEFGNDPRVEIKGFLSNQEVDNICREADALLSVREPSVTDNVVNYPSKIAQYLAWGKPVVSTWVPSLSPDYREVLEIGKEDTPEAFAEKIDEVLGWSLEQKRKKYSQIKEWFESKKSWKSQAERLVAWLERL